MDGGRPGTSLTAGGKAEVQAGEGGRPHPGAHLGVTSKAAVSRKRRHLLSWRPIACTQPPPHKGTLGNTTPTYGQRGPIG